MGSLGHRGDPRTAMLRLSWLGGGGWICLLQTSKLSIEAKLLL